VVTWWEILSEEKIFFDPSNLDDCDFSEELVKRRKTPRESMSGGRQSGGSSTEPKVDSITPRSSEA
jgi:hypothetical protein